jgi:hypothetical protein
MIRALFAAAAMTATILLADSVLVGATSPAAHACCEGIQPPTPAEQKFIADVHSEGLPGVDATEEIRPEGYRVQIENWPGINARDSNILYAGYAICNSLAGAPGTSTFDYWRRIYWMLGEPIDPTDAYHPRIDHVVQFARADLGCRSTR